MRIRHCAVRAIVRQPWLFENPDELSRALTRLVVDVLAARLSIQLDRAGQVAPLGTVAMRVVLPVPVVLALADESPTSSHGRRLSSFGAEVAVHDAASSALRVAMERATFEPAKPQRNPRWPESTKTAVACVESGAGSEPAENATEPPESDASTVYFATSNARRLAAAVAATLLAAERLGRLGHVMQHSDAALIAEWVRMLDGAIDAVPAVPPGMHERHWSDLAATMPSIARLDASGRRPGDAPPEPGANVAAEAPVSKAGERRPTEAEVDATIGAVLAALEGTADSAAVRLEAAAIAAAGLGVAVSDASVWHALQRRLGPVISESSTAPVVEAPAPLVPVSSPSLSQPHGRRPPTRQELEVASVLPFLLVGSLDELGVLDALIAALAGPDWGDLLAAFAGCLARKALPPPGGGWLHTPEVAATVAAFAGQQDVPDGAATERLGQTVARWWPVVAEVVTATLVDLRTPESPLVVTGSPAGLVVADADGLPPMLWDADIGDVERLWADCGRPPVLADSSLASTLLATFVPISDEARTAPLAELVTLADERPASGREGLVPELDTPLSLLAGVGLSAVAWELWQQHENAHPALAIHRLGDLDGRVTLESDRVTVRMPLGRRHADLRDSGLLRTVDDVPWLHGRRLELLGG